MDYLLLGIEMFQEVILKLTILEIIQNLYIVNNGDYLISMDGEFKLGEWRGGKATKSTSMPY